jgi:amino acid permease
MPINQLLIYVFGALVAFGLTGLYIYIGVYLGNKDNNNEIYKHLLRISVGTGILVLFFGAMSYLYFMTDLNSALPYLLLSQPVILFLALYAVSACSLQIVNQ